MTVRAEWSTPLTLLVLTRPANMRTLQAGQAIWNDGAFITEPVITWLTAGVHVAEEANKPSW